MHSRIDDYPAVEWVKRCMGTTHPTLREMLRLYAVTDRRWLPRYMKLSQAVEQAIVGGVTCIQLREKLNMPSIDTGMPWGETAHPHLKALASEVGAVCRAHQVPYIVNDFFDLAQAVEADGVHVGQRDRPTEQVQQALRGRRIVGVSASGIDEARTAQAMGADYVGVGAIFPTGTKDDAEHVTLDELAQICAELTIPVVAIGGINLKNIMQLRDTGIAGVAVVSALFAAPDIALAAQQLRQCIDEVIV